MNRLSSGFKCSLVGGVFSALLLTGCTGKSTISPSLNNSGSEGLTVAALGAPVSNFLVTVGGPVPEVTSLPKEVPELFGFAPSSIPFSALTITDDKILFQDPSTGTALEIPAQCRLINADNTRLNSNAEIVSIEENPLWYAPEEYFVERELPVPAEGDSDRFLRGALGELAFYLSNGLVVHTGDFFFDETTPQAVVEKSNLESLLRYLDDNTIVSIK